MIKHLVFSVILIIVFSFITLFSPSKIDATYDSDECIEHYGWYWVGSEYWGDSCGTPWQGGNYCCSGSKKGNNVCNDEFQCTVSEEGWCTHGPYRSSSMVKHDCTWGGGTYCGICYRGETQTETTDEISCTSNPSQCGGYSGRCDQYLTVKERSRTCNSNCGGWSGWSDWYTIDEYPQCPTDSRINCGTCTPPPTCGDGSCNNGETCSTCSQDCGSCPPNARYRCSGSNCIRDDAGGTTTNPSCGGLCSGPPSGCPNVSVSVSPNPVDINSPVTFSATSSHPYANANISHGGGAQGGDDFSITGSYTWRWVYDPPNRWGNSSSTPGNYNATFSGNRPGGGSSCTFTTPYTVRSSTPANLAVSGQPSCALAPYSVNFSWQNTNSTLWLDISESPQFNGFANKNVSNQTSTSSAGFTLRPGTTYYWRLWNGSSHTSGPSFFVPACPLTVSKPACSTGSYTATLNWQGTNPTLWADIDPDGNWADRFYNKNVSNQTDTAAPAGFWGALGLSGPMPSLNAGTTYYWRLWNGSEHIAGPNFSVPLCNTTVRGRIWKDRNGDQNWQSASEELIKSGAPSCSESVLPNAFIPDKGINYTGPVNFTNFPDQCNEEPGYGSAPFYSTAPLPPGAYTFTVQAPSGWRTYSRTVNLPADDTDNDQVVRLWWGPNPPPENFSLSPLSCSDAAYSRTLSWQNTTQGANSLALQLSDDGFATFSSRDVSTLTSTVLSNLQPSTYYSTRVDNGTGVYAIGPTWRILPCLKAWIQVIGGDVHSNAKIKVAPGP